MGVLKHLATGRTIVLASRFAVGRDPTSGVFLSDPQSSTIHASLAWTKDHWEVRDHGSRNHTFIGARVVPPPTSAPIKRGDVLRFGCDAESWELIDQSGPWVVATKLPDGELRSAEEEGLLALPDPENNVLLSIVLDRGECWMAESPDGTRRPVTDGEELVLAGTTWKLQVPPVATVIDGTKQAADAPSVATMRLRLHVSGTAENVRAEVLGPTGTISLGERASFYLLSVLAEERLKEAQAGTRSPSEQGWYDVPLLCTYLGTDERNLNVTVYRARALFAKAGVEGAEGIVERRFRQIRIGTGQIEIVKA